MNVNEKDVDPIISNYFKKMGEMPKEMETDIKNMNLKISKKNKIIDIIKFMIACATLLSGTACATYYIEKYSDIYDEGLRRAMQNGYVHEYEPNVANYYEDENIKIYGSSIMLDDYNIREELSIEFKKNINIEEYYKSEIKNVIIYDEKNNIYFYDNYDILSEFTKRQKTTEENLNFLGGVSIGIGGVNKNKGIISLVGRSDEKKFPKSKKIYIEFKTIELKNNKDKNKKDISLNGTWKIETDIPEKFQNRENILYNIEKCDSRIYKDKLKVETTETCTKFDLAMQWGDYEYWTKKTDEIRKQDVMASCYIKADKSYIENENGEKFYATFEGSGSRLKQDGTLEVMCNFACLKSNSTNKMKIVLIDINNEKIEIELYK